MNRQEIKDELRKRPDKFSWQVLNFLDRLETEVLNLEHSMLVNEGVGIEYYDNSLPLISEILESQE